MKMKVRKSKLDHMIKEEVKSRLDEKKQPYSAEKYRPVWNNLERIKKGEKVSSEIEALLDEMNRVTFTSIGVGKFENSMLYMLLQWLGEDNFENVKKVAADPKKGMGDFQKAVRKAADELRNRLVGGGLTSLFLFAPGVGWKLAVAGISTLFGAEQSLAGFSGKKGAGALSGEKTDANTERGAVSGFAQSAVGGDSLNTAVDILSNYDLIKDFARGLYFVLLRNDVTTPAQMVGTTLKFFPQLKSYVDKIKEKSEKESEDEKDTDGKKSEDEENEELLATLVGTGTGAVDIDPNDPSLIAQISY